MRQPLVIDGGAMMKLELAGHLVAGDDCRSITSVRLAVAIE